MIPQRTITAIYNRADIVEVGSHYTRLIKRGPLYEAHCIFGHEDKTPSFKINPVKGIFKCFSCDKGGDVVALVKAKENCEWIDAMRWLADFYNIPIEEVANSPEEAAQIAARKQQLADLETLCIQYEDCLLKPTDTPLEQHPPYQYLLNRGITLETIQTFNLGYGGLNDRYRNRITFAIRNDRGQCVGFAGRVISAPKNEIPKYINSAETPLYKKSTLLYGLYQAKQSLRKQQTGYLVEGYTDVLAMHQHGITNTIATCGTALTKQQVALLKRFTPHITILFDGDAAGQKATIKAIQLLLEGGLLVDVVHLPNKQDPADYLASTPNPSNALAALHKDFLSYLLDTIPAAADVPTRVAVHKTILEAISYIPDVSYRHEYCKEFATRIDRNLEEIRQEVQLQIGQNVQKKHAYAKKSPADSKTNKKHKTTPDGTHYLVEYASPHALTIAIPIPVTWDKHWSPREWLALENALIYTIVVHGDIILHQEGEQFTLKQCIQEILKESNIRLQIPVLDCMLFDTETTVVNGYDYAADIFRIRTEIEASEKLWKETMQGLPQEEVDIPTMAGQLIERYEKKVAKWRQATEWLTSQKQDKQ